MSRKHPLTLAEGWQALKGQHAHGKPPPAKLPQSLTVQKIKLRPEVFQHRRPAKHASEAHIKGLMDAARARKLDPIQVWWDGKHWTCIDGHHRLEACKRAWVTEVAVTVFTGTPEAAVIQAAKGNTRDKLQMSATEKLGAAWRIVTTSTTASKQETAEASGASERSVANMRRVRDSLRAKGTDPAELSWGAARAMDSGETLDGDFDFEARDEREAQEMANRLLKALGKRGQQRVEVLARALEIYGSQIPAQLAEYWSDKAPDEGEF